MLESYITPVLMSYVDKYIKNLKPSDLNLSLWGGDVSLSNLELNLHALEQELNFPVTFLSGKIHELHIHVPWTKLYYEPAVITINTIECVLKLKENSFTVEGVEEADEVQQADIKPTSDSTAPQAENEKTLPPGYVQSLLNKVIYNLTVKVNNFILKYVEDDIVLSLNVKSAEFHSANENWIKAFVDVAAPDWILHKMCNISDLTVCLDRRNASGIIEMYQDPLAYKCNLSCRMQVYFDKEGFHLPLEKNLSVYCECLEVSVTDQQLPLLLRLLKLGLSLYYGTLDLPGCEPAPHAARDLIDKKEQKSNPSIMSQLPGTFIPGSELEVSETGWLSWAASMVPGLSGHQKIPEASLTPLVSRFGVYISQASLNFKITEPISDGNFLGSQRFVFKPILTVEASGVAQEMVTRGSTFFDFQMGVTSLTGWLVDTCVCKNDGRLQNAGGGDEDGNTREPEEELFLRVGTKETSVNKGISFLKGSLFDQEPNSSEKLQLTENADEFLRKNSESNVLSRFGAMFFEYLYTMNVENNEDGSYYESTPAVKEESHQRLIVGPSMLQITSGVVHRLEMVGKLAEDDANSRKEKDEIPYDDFVEDQLLSGNVSQRHMHVTILDASLVIMTSDHVKSAHAQNESARSSEGTLSEIQEEETEFSAGPAAVSCGCVFQVERMDLQKTAPMFPLEMLKLIKEKKGSKMLLPYAHSNMYAKVFGFQVGVSKHEVDFEDPMILNILPACNTSLFAKQSLVARQPDGVNDIEARFELASLSVNITKPQLVLLQNIYNSWTSSILPLYDVTSESSLIQDVFHPSAKEGGKIPVLIEAFVQDIKVQLYITSEEISSSGSLGSIKATVMSLSGETTENTPVLYGPLITADIYNGECFKRDENRSFKMETLEPWLAFTVKIPMIGLDGNTKETRSPNGGAVLLKCNGTVINLDPVLFTWLAYYPRTSPSSDTPSRGKLLKKAASHTRSMSAVTPRKKSYARGHISPAHAQKKKKRYSQQRKRLENTQESAGQDFDGWVWEKLPFLASVVIQVDVESVAVFAPSSHVPYDAFPEATWYDIPGNFIRQLHKQESTLKTLSGLVLSLPAFKIRSSGHQDLAICHDILRHPLILPPRDHPETLPWILTADNASIFTVWIGGDRQDVEVYFVLDPMCSRAMLASAKTSHSRKTANETQNQKATLDFALHTDFNPLTINCSKKQVDLLFELYSNAVQLTSSVSSHALSQKNEATFPTRSVSSAIAGSSRNARRTASITSSSGFEVVDEDSLSSESTPKPSMTSAEAVKISPSLVHVSLWVQWTLPKLSFNIFGSDSLNGSDLRITTELEDWSASFDYQNGHFQAQCKVGNLSITHYEVGSSGQWIAGSCGGTILARQDSLSSSLSKVHDSDSETSDPGPHGFLSVEYTATLFPSFKAAKEISEHDDVFQNASRFSQDVHVTIQPFDFILWYPLLYSVTTIFHSFTSLQATSGQKCESRGVPSLESSMDARQSLTNLPEVNLKLRGFRLVVPSRIEPHKTKETLNRNLARSSDLFAIQAKALVVSSRFDNPTSRLVVDKKLSKALTAFARSRRGSAVERRFGDTQYQIEMKGLRVWSGCWDELCRMLPSKDTSRIERDLLEQNPAFEWNTYSGQDRNDALVIPVISDLDIKCVVAPPVSLTTSSKSQHSTKPIFGLSFEVNLTTDLECFFSKSQVQLMQTIVKENFMNSGLSDATGNVPAVAENRASNPTISHRLGVALSDEKLDSGICSECSQGRRRKHVMRSRDDKLDVQEMECLLTAGGLSVFVYEHATTGEVRPQLVPVLRASLMQPAFTCTRRAECDTIQVSCFDLSLAKCKSSIKITDDLQLTPSSDDYDVIWLRTGDGSPDTRTELSPGFLNFTCKLYPASPADLKLDFGRPIWIDIDLGLLERLKHFTTDLYIEPTTLDSVDEPSSDSEVVSFIRSAAISTDYVAITLTAGQDSEVDATVKMSCASTNLGVSLKTDERQDFCQRVAASLHLCGLALSTSIENKFRSFVLPYDASIDLELFSNSPTASQDTQCEWTVQEIFIWLDSGLLQVNFGQEHLKCINIFTENLVTFVHNQFGPSGDVHDTASGSSLSPDLTPTVHRSEDDLRTGPFKYITTAASDVRPNPYEIVFTDEGLPTMTWRYPEPRALSSIHIIPVPFTTFTSYPSPVMEEDRLLPCILRYWDNVQKSYVEHATFYISESASTDVALCDPVNSPLSEVVAASEWQVIANIALAPEESEISSDDEGSSVFSEKSNIPSPISATSLAACMKVDSVFCSSFVPRLSIAATVSVMQLTVYNHMENMHRAIARRFQGYSLQEDIPKSQEFFCVMAENSTVIVKSWPQNNVQCLIWSNIHADVLDSRELRWKSLLNPVDVTLALLRNEKLQKTGKISSVENPLDWSLDVSCGDVVVDASQTRIHTISGGLLAWQDGGDPVLSHFIICNNTNQAIKFGQDGTEESIVLRSKELTFYSWATRDDLCHQKLHVCLNGEGRWCEAFGIDSPGVTNRAVQYSLHTATLIIEVQKMSGLQRKVIFHSSHVVKNHTSHDVEVQLLQNPALTQVTSPTLQVLHNLVIPAQSSSPSYVISHGGLAGIRVRLRGETTWSGTLPIEDQIPNYKQHCVVQMLGTKEFKNFYIWYNAVCVDALFGQIEISFSPLFIIKNYLPRTIQLTAVSASGDVTTTHDAPGEAEEHQLFDLPPDTWHYITFKLPHAKVSSNPSVPLNTTLHELTDKVKRADESDGLRNAKWPFSSKSLKTSSDSYLKPVESTLVRHVQSSHDGDVKRLGEESNDLSCVELQCQILNKWEKLRTILLEVKPWILFENKSGVMLYLKDETGQNVFDVKPGEVISPSKFKSFCVGVFPPWLDDVCWSETISLVDNDHPGASVSGSSLEQYGQMQCAILVPSPSGNKLCPLLLMSSIVMGIRVVTIQETTRIVSKALPRPLLVQPVMVNDVTSKLKETAFSSHTRITLSNTENQSDIVSRGIPFWDISCENESQEVVTNDSLFLLVFGLPRSSDDPDAASKPIQWSRPVRIQQGIVRQCLFIETSNPDALPSVVIITLIESGLIKIVVSEDKVPRLFLTNHCETPIQFGQCPTTTDKEKAKGTTISGRDLVVSENLEQYTTLPRLESNCSVYYEPPELRENFLTKKPQFRPKIRVQVLKQAHVKEVAAGEENESRIKTIYMPQGWSEAIDVTCVGKTAYELPGKYRLYVEVAKKTSFLTHVVFSDTCGEVESEIEEEEESAAELKINCDVSNFSICLHDESSWVEASEVFRVNLEEISLSALCTDMVQTHIEVSLLGLQIDNQMMDDFYHFPVVLLPLEDESRSTKRKAKKTLKPLLNCCFDLSLCNEKAHVHLLSIQLEPLSVFIEDTFLYRLAGLFDSFILPEHETEPCGNIRPCSDGRGAYHRTTTEEHSTDDDDFRSETERKSTRYGNFRTLSERSPATDDDIRALTLASAVISPVLIDRISIEPVYVLVTFHASVKLFVSANHTPLFFSKFEMTSLFTDPSFLAQLLAVHYAYAALMKVGWVVGSLDILGGPASFIRSLGQGVVDFFYLPYDGLTRGPTAFVAGMTRGVSSFMSHISAGALTSVTNLASSISRNLDRLSFDDQHVRFQEQQRADGVPRRVISGFTHGLSGFMLSVLGAVAGVADQPLQGLFRAESVRDVTSGLLTGVGKGLIGVVTKPLGGAMELVSQTGQGILQGTGLGEIPKRLHEARCGEEAAGFSSNLKYVWKLLESKCSIDNLFVVTVSVVVSGNSHFDAILIMSCDAIMFVDTDDDTILSAFVLKQVDMREDPQHPRAILVEHHVPGTDTISDASSFAELSPTSTGLSRDLANRSSHQFLSEMSMTLFMDPVYLRPLLSRFKLLKSGY